MKTAEDIINDKGSHVITVSPDTTLYDALKIMNENGIGAIVVEETGEYVGIWTERNLMKDAMKDNFNLKSEKVSDYMTKELIKAGHGDSIPQLQDKFLGKRLRHLIIEKEGKNIGILSAGDVSRASLLEKSEELKSLNAICSWEYYENWQWKKK